MISASEQENGIVELRPANGLFKRRRQGARRVFSHSCSRTSDSDCSGQIEFQAGLRVLAIHAEMPQVKLIQLLKDGDKQMSCLSH